MVVLERAAIGSSIACFGSYSLMLFINTLRYLRTSLPGFVICTRSFARTLEH